MPQLKRLLLAPPLVLLLIVLLAMAVVIGLLFPQAFTLSPLEAQAWRNTFPIINRIGLGLGLNHIYTSLWFSGIIGGGVLSLLLSLRNQIRAALRRGHGPWPFDRGSRTTVDCPLHPLLHRAQRHGYHLTWRGERAWRLIKHRWGYWGGTLLHLGLLVTTIAAILCALTQQRGVLRLTEGRAVAAGTSFGQEERGPLATKSLFLPKAIRLDRVLADFWPTNELRDLQTTISFLGPTGSEEHQRLAVNHPLHLEGLRFDQSRTFGRSFFVTLSQKNQPSFGLQIDLESPSSPEVASYGTFSFPEIDLSVRTKYYGDANQQQRDSPQPLLVIRLTPEEGGGEVPLKPGQSGPLGPYTATLVDSARWIDFSVTKIQGIPLLFGGFLLIILGCGLIYCLPPREIHIQQQGERVTLRWLAGRFRDCHAGELDDILQEATAHNE